MRKCGPTVAARRAVSICATGSSPEGSRRLPGVRWDLTGGSASVANRARRDARRTRHNPFQSQRSLPYRSCSRPLEIRRSGLLLAVSIHGTSIVDRHEARLRSLSFEKTRLDCSFVIRERIACAAPPGGVLRQNLPRKEIVDIARCRVLRAFGKHCPFGRVSFPSNPSNMRLRTARCRSLKDSPACTFQNLARSPFDLMVDRRSYTGWLGFLNTVRTERFDQVLALRPILASIGNAASAATRGSVRRP